MQLQTQQNWINSSSNNVYQIKKKLLKLELLNDIQKLNELQQQNISHYILFSDNIIIINCKIKYKYIYTPSTQPINALFGSTSIVYYHHQKNNANISIKYHHNIQYKKYNKLQLIIISNSITSTTTSALRIKRIKKIKMMKI